MVVAAVAAGIAAAARAATDARAHCARSSSRAAEKAHSTAMRGPSREDGFILSAPTLSPNIDTDIGLRVENAD